MLLVTMHRTAVRFLGISFLLAFVLLLPSLGLARERKANRAAVDDKPVIIVNVANLDRLLNHAVFAFEQGGRPEFADTISVGLSKINDLKGLDRQQSMGLMFYVNNVLTERLMGSDKPMLSPVAYVPVKNFEDLLKTMQVGPAISKKVGDNLYEISNPANLRKPWHVLVRGEYAFLADRRDTLDHNLGNPAAFSKALSSAYDVGVSVNLGSLSQMTRDFVSGAIRAQAENDLQRRDSESPAAHRIRKAVGIQRLELLEQVLAQGEQLTLGWSLSEAEKTSAIEMVVAARPGSDFAAALNDLRGSRTHFANLLMGQPAAGVALSLKLNKGNRKQILEMLAGFEMQLSSYKQGDAATPAAADAAAADAQTSLQKLIGTFSSTVEQGHVDGFAQFVGKPPGPYVLVAGLKIADVESAVEPLRELFQRLKGNVQVSELELNSFTHQGITFHRIKSTTMGKGDDRLFGEKWSVYAGAGNTVMWVCVGGDEAVTEMKKAIDRVAEPVANPGEALPLQFVMNLSEWMEVFDSRKRAALARQAFTPGKDAVRMDVQGIQDGVRLRLRFDEGFTKLVGLGMVRRAEADERRRTAAEEAKKKAAEAKPEGESNPVPEK